MRRNRRDDRDEDNGFAQWGGYMEAKKSKLVEQFNEDALQIDRESDIFNGIAILVNGLTNPNADELKRLMALHGGTYHMYQSHKTTHIIASNLPNVKINKMGALPIVKPAWISDSIDLGRLQDYRRYLLYTNQSVTQPRLDFPTIQKQASPTKTASDPRFLEEFYNNSRLHLISTLGAEFKQLVGKLREESCGTFPGRDKLLSQLQESVIDKSKLGGSRVIMHIDMDCFFVSVGLRTRPELRGQPVAVTHARNPKISNSSKDRADEIALNLDRFLQRGETIDVNCSMSEVASCSYEARRCGVKNGMFLGAAAKLCPNLKTIPYDFQGYREVSNALYRTIASYTLDIEAVSCDEMYVDITEILITTGLSVAEWAEHIRGEITAITECPCSTGFGANRLQARIATKRAKPNGQFYLKPDDVETHLAEVALADLPGIGRALMSKLEALDMRMCGDVQRAPLHLLQKELGRKVGETIWEQSRGVDRRPLNFQHERKSVSAEINYGIRFKTLQECHNFLESLSQEVFNRLDEIRMRSRCVTLKLMIRAPEAPVETAKYLGHGICDAISNSMTSQKYFSDPVEIFREVRGLYDRFGVYYEELRGIGIQLTKLEKNAPVNNVLSKFLAQKTSKSVMQDPVASILQESVIPNEQIIQETRAAITKTVKKEVVTTSKRGRPKGSGGGVSKKPVKKIRPANTLNKFFKATKEQTTNNPVKVTATVDMSVLRELPAELQAEIIKEYQLDVSKIPVMTSSLPPATAMVTERLVAPSTITSSSSLSLIEAPSTVVNITKNNSPFVGLKWSDLKLLLKQWLETEETPFRDDIEMLGLHLKELAMNGTIELLPRIMRFLYRLIIGLELNCEWHQAYLDLIQFLQNGMVARYDAVLFLVNTKFDCCRQPGLPT